MTRCAVTVLLSAVWGAPAWAGEEALEDRRLLRIDVRTAAGEPIHEALGRTVPLFCVVASGPVPKRVPAYVVQEGYVRWTRIPGVVKAALPCTVALVLGEQVVLSKRVEHSPVVLTVEPERILGLLRTAEPKLVDAVSGNPVTEVSAVLVAPWMGRLLRVKDGKCTVVGLPPCSGRIDISGGPYAMASIDLEQAVRGEEVRLVPATTIRGEVLPDTDDPRFQVRIRYYTRGRELLSTHLRSWPGVPAGPDGSFVIHCASRDTVVCAAAEGYAVAAKAVPAVGDGPVNLAFRMVRGYPVRVTTSRKDVMAPRFVVRTKRGVVCFAGTVCEGKVAELRLAKGTYTLEYASSGGPWTKQRFVVTKGKDRTSVSIP